jgi:hypothetical protein
MLMADVAAWTALLAGLMIVLPAVWLLFGALWPAALGRAQARIPARPLSTFFVGLGVALAFAAAIGLLVKLNAAPIALGVLAFSLGWSFLGVSALARHAGSRLTSALEPAWKAHLRGSFALAFSFLVPFLGWLLVLPIALVLGAGAATLGVFRRPAAPAVASPQRDRVEVGA